MTLWGVWREMQGTGSRPDSQTLTLVKVNEKEEIKREIKRENEMTVTQGGAQTHDLANGLPCSNQLTYRVIRQLSG